MSMESAVFDTMTVDIDGVPRKIKDNSVLNLRATGQKMVFKGFMALYIEERTTRRTRPISFCLKFRSTSICILVLIRFSIYRTSPRYTEATLVKSLEEKGIGRPSTYV